MQVYISGMKFEKQNSAGFLVNQMARLFARGLGQRIAPLGLLIGQFPVLLELWEKDGLTQKDLVKRLDLEQATLANTLARMERDGLIRRTRHPKDARSQQVWLTDRARALHDSACAAADAQNAQALASLNTAERAQFIALTRRIIAAMHET